MSNELLTANPLPGSALSESEEMYLITIANLIESQLLQVVPLSLLAEALKIHAVSTNQMIRKLEESGLVDYLPYKGVSLTERGERAARRMIRNRRLWEVFLVRHLQLPVDRAVELACGMEHITDGAVCARLAKFLEYPQFDPLGNLIPACDEEPAPEPWFPLAQARLHDRVLVRQIDCDPAARAFLMNEGIYPGAELEVLGLGEKGGLLLQLDTQRFHLAADVAAQVLVRRVPPITASQENPT
ncbi:MAG: metal-dependent transcriptional regulator [Anaerolineae bacterium]|nr:metal-dependent transcriptional regulator [Anaerolineae bacterium]